MTECGFELYQFFRGFLTFESCYCFCYFTDCYSVILRTLVFDPSGHLIDLLQNQGISYENSCKT